MLHLDVRAPLPCGRHGDVYGKVSPCVCGNAGGQSAEQFETPMLSDVVASMFNDYDENDSN